MGAALNSVVSYELMGLPSEIQRNSWGAIWVGAPAFENFGHRQNRISPERTPVGLKGMAPGAG